MPRLQVRAVLCDLDGTLVDSGLAVSRAWKIWCERNGLDPGPFLERCHGMKTADLIGLCAPQIDAQTQIPEVERLVAEQPSPATHGAAELLSFLPDGAWAIVTSSTAPLAESRFREPTSLKRPPVLVTAEDVAAGKPDPAGYLLAASKLGVPPESCLVLEDAPAGIRAGKRAGMLVAACLTTHERAALSEADFVVSGPGEIRVLGAVARPEGGWDLALNVETA